MPVKDYIRRIAGRDVKTPFTVVGGTTAQGGDGVGLDDNGLLDISLFPPSIDRADAVDGTAAGALPARAMVYFPGDGTIVLATAAAGSAKDAMGFVLAASANGAPARAFTEPGTLIPGFSGLTPGAPYYLSETAGQITPTAVSGTGGKLDQFIGYAVSATVLKYDPEPRGTLLP